MLHAKYNIDDADDNVEKSITFADSFRGLAQAARKARIICSSALGKPSKKNTFSL